MSVASRPSSKRYLGNNHPDHLHVHDLRNERANCQTSEIVAAGNAVIFSPDDLGQAQSEGYEGCTWCIGASAG